MIRRRALLSADDAADRVAWELLDEPGVRVGLLGAVLLTIALAAVLGTPVDARVFVVTSVLGLLLLFGSFLRPLPAGLRAAGWHPGVTWSAAVALLGPVLIAVLLLAAVEVAVEPFAPLFGLLLLLAAILPPRALRWPLLSWQLAIWVAIVALSGERAPAVLLVHLAGGLALAVTVVRTAEALSGSYDEAYRARLAAEQRAELLASLLRTHDLDPAVVLRSVADGLLGLGFDVAAVREIDRDSGVARIIEGVARGELVVEEELPLEAPEFDLLLRTEEPVLLGPGPDEPANLADLRLYSALLFPVFEDGQMVAVVAAGSSDRAVGSGVTDAAELLVAQAGAALERARLYRRDQSTVEQLRRLEQRTQDFISTVSHELRTPLTVVQGLGSTLDERWDDLDDERRDDLLRRIDANADRLATMVTRLLDTSQLSRGALQPVPREVELRRLLRAAMDRLHDVLAAHPVEVDVVPATLVRVDDELFEHVTDNLLLNLARHTPPGTTGRLCAWEDGDRVVIELMDDGPGIEAHDLPHVLDRFYRGGDESHRVSTGGLGLGLALAAEVVRAHGGRLSVASGDGGGARFRFDVPRARPR